MLTTTKIITQLLGKDLNFADALALLQKNSKIETGQVFIYRSAWKEDVSVSIEYSYSSQTNRSSDSDFSQIESPYFVVTSRFGKVPWIPTYPEMLYFKDWTVAKSNTIVDYLYEDES